jgi:hypothetical protein
MANICGLHTVRGCPASHYLICKAYATGRNCWEVPGRPCCKQEDLAQCLSCSVYMKGNKAMAASEAESSGA